MRRACALFLLGSGAIPIVSTCCRDLTEIEQHKCDHYRSSFTTKKTKTKKQTEREEDQTEI